MTRRCVDALASLFVFVFATAVGYYAIRAAGGLGVFSAEGFNPALTLACAGTLSQNEYTAAADAFLHVRSETLDCKDVLTIAGSGLSPFQHQTFYLIATVGLIWRILGIDWAHVATLACLFYGLLGLGVYALARLFVPWRLALGVAVALVLSPFSRAIVPQIRDLAKAPIVIGVLFLLLFSVKQWTVSNARSSIALTLAGAVIGIGMGFRAEIFLLIPLCLVALVGVAIQSRQYFRAAATGALFMAAVTLVAYPVLSEYTSSSIMGHVSLLGLTPPFTQRLGLTPSLYRIGAYWSDTELHNLIMNYSGRTLSFTGPEYNKYSMTMLLEYARTFPADIVTRASASISNVMLLKMNGTDSPFRTIPLTYGTLTVGIGVIVIAVSLVAVDNFLLGASLLIAFLYLVGGGVLQFDNRHLFHLQTFPLLFIAIIASFISAGFQPLNWRMFCRAAATCGAAFLAFQALLFGLRTYQNHHIQEIFNSYLMAQQSPMTTKDEPSREGPGVTLVRVLDAGQVLSSSVESYYVHATFDSSDCAADIVHPKVLYRDDPPYIDLSALTNVPIGKSGKSHIIFPALTCESAICGHTRFEGLTIPANYRGCITGIFAFRQRPGLPLWITMGPDWQQKPLYETLNLGSR